MTNLEERLKLDIEDLQVFLQLVKNCKVFNLSNLGEMQKGFLAEQNDKDLQKIIKRTRILLRALNK